MKAKLFDFQPIEAAASNRNHSWKSISRKRKTQDTNLSKGVPGKADELGRMIWVAWAQISCGMKTTIACRRRGGINRINRRLHVFSDVSIIALRPNRISK